jgi:hypothetical protein
MNIPNKYCLEIWIGLVKIKSTSGKNRLLGNAKRGYVNVIALASSKSDYSKKVKEALFEMNMEAIRLEDVEPLHSRVQHYSVDKAIIAQAKQILKGRERVRFSTFHTYDD